MSKDAAMETTTGELPPDYTGWLASLKQRIRSAQQRAALAVNRELVLLYWQIGQDILARQQAQGWGAKVIERLARDPSAAFPGMKGFSPRNLKYMGPLRRRGRMGQLCKGCLHNCHGFIYAFCSTR
jgi:predicted nuclease of restriction endonuclease-like (RecB) superfamily